MKPIEVITFQNKNYHTYEKSTKFDYTYFLPPLKTPLLMQLDEKYNACATSNPVHDFPRCCP